MLILFCISLILGATLFFSFGFYFLEIGIVSVLWGTLFCFLARTKKVLVLGLTLTFTVILGALRMWMIPVSEVPFGNQAFTAVVKSVDERLDKTMLVVRMDNSDAVVQVTLREKQRVLPGDAVSVRGKVELPEDFVTNTGRLFDYDQYLSSKGVDAVVGFGQVVKLEDGKISFTRVATRIRQWIAQTLSSHIAFPVDGIVAGVLVGFQGGIPKYLSDIFRDTGTLHTLVLSGYNITVLAGFLGLLLRRLPFRIRTVLIGVGIALLVLVSGAGVAAVRAGIMGSIALVASMSLQNYSVLRALFLSALLFFFVSPMTIFVDPGFHLSFLATLFIITLLPILKEKFVFIPNDRFNIRELLVLAVGLPIFMLPYMMYFSGLFPLVSPIANIFLVPIIPVLMLAGLLVVAFSFIPFLAGIVGSLTSFIGLIAIKVLTFFSMFPQWQTPALPGWCVVLIYIVLFVVVFRKEINSYVGHVRKMFQAQID
ncbi:MAG: ComEC/Rec2 family competence protein [Patescibacteria group bacterium]